MGQHKVKVTSKNLVQEVDSALDRCRSELQRAENTPANPALSRDLKMAIQALELVSADLHGDSERPKGRRGGMFTRYVIDEEPQMVIPAELKDLIIQIESVNRRMR
jgi:hypothetical protein